MNVCAYVRDTFEQMLFNKASLNEIQLWIPSLFLNANADGFITDNFFIFFKLLYYYIIYLIDKNSWIYY